MNFSRLFLFLFVWSAGFWLSSAVAQDPMVQTPSNEELFREGTNQYQGGKYVEAAKSFETLARQEPDQPELLLNWGLAEFQAGRRGLAIGIWRRALTLNPSLSSAREALTFATQALQLQDFNQSSLVGRLRNNVLAYVGFNQMMSVTLIFLATGGWLLLGYFGKRRKALRQDLPLPQFSWAGSLLTFAFMMSLLLTVLKGIETTIPHATATTMITARTAPDKTSSSLFELREGSDVIVRQAKEGWSQVRHPGGMSGWVPNETLFQTSGIPLW